MSKWHEVKDGGKGSSPRPVNKEKFDKNFDRIFKNKKKIDITKLKNVYEETSKKNDRKNKG
jgi:hypothetical protein|tara:strand:+ start:413 stop:595 length:183 start_codon:yes stop_codon:yes gene_type:complete